MKYLYNIELTWSVNDFFVGGGGIKMRIREGKININQQAFSLYSRQIIILLPRSSQ